MEETHKKQTSRESKTAKNFRFAVFSTHFSRFPIHTYQHEIRHKHKVNRRKTYLRDTKKITNFASAIIENNVERPYTDKLWL